MNDIFEARRQELEQAKAKNPKAHNGNGARVDIERYLSDHGCNVVRIKSNGDGTLYCLDHCVFDENHTSNEAAIVQTSDGKLTYQCFHETCKGKTWHDARGAISGEISLSPWMVGGNGHNRTKPTPNTCETIIDTSAESERFIKAVSAAIYLNEPAPPADPIFENVVDKRQRFAVIGGTKRRKSFVVLTMAVLSAIGREGTGLRAVKPRKTLLVQFEIEERYMWRRVRKICRHMGITVDMLGDRLHIVNLRDQLDDDNFEEEALRNIVWNMKMTGAEVLLVDPIYVLITGEENETSGMRRLLRRLGTTCRENNEAGLIYAHHDKKSGHYDQELSNRGSGTGLTARDYDGAMFLSPHESGDDELTVVEFLVRHSAPREPYCLRWEWGDDFHGFVVTDDIPNKATKATKARRELSSYIEKARGIISEYKSQIVKTLPTNAPPPMMPKKLFSEKMSAHTGQKALRSFCIEYIFDEEEQTGGPDSPIRAYTDKSKKNKKFVDNSLTWKNTNF